jgi:hypothetical protein
VASTRAGPAQALDGVPDSSVLTGSPPVIPLTLPHRAPNAASDNRGMRPVGSLLRWIVNGSALLNARHGPPFPGSLPSPSCRRPRYLHTRTRVRIMALSEDDQRRFDEIERALMDQDPVFSRTMTIDRLRRRRVRAGVGFFCGGVLLLLTGLICTQVSLAWGVLTSIAGFVVMVVATAQSIGRRYRR